MGRALLGLIALFALACGSTQAKPADGPARVRVVQVEGLGPDLLTAYLARASARGADRALHRWLDLGAPAARVTPQRGAVVEGWSVLPTRSGPLAATLLTGKLPAEHGAWADTDTPRGLAPKAALVNPPWQPDALDDAARLAALRDHAAPVAYARLTGVAEALANGGPSAGPEALAALDKTLAATWPTLPANTAVILIGAQADAGLQASRGLPPAPVAGLLGVPADALRPAGALLMLPPLSPEQAAKLDAVDATRAVLRVEAQGVSRWDAQLRRLRPLTPHDALGPDAVARLHASAPEGTWLALASPEFEFVPEGVTPGKRHTGGPSAAESAMVYVFAGAPFAGGLRGPEAMAPEHLHALIAGLRGAPIAAGLPAPAPVAAQAPPTDTIAIPWVAALGGPATFAVAPAEIEAAAQIRDGVAALRAGLTLRAWETLRAAAGKAPPALEPWRAFFAWRAGTQLPDLDEADQPARPEGGRVGLLAALTQPDDTKPWPPTGVTDDVGRALVLLGPPKAPALCAAVPFDATALGGAADVFAAAGLPGFAATAMARLALASRTPAAAAAARTRALDHLGDPDAAWAVPAVTQMIAGAILMAPILGDRAGPDDLERATERQLLDLQRLITADDQPGAAARNVTRLSSLSLSVLAANPMLLNETLDLGLGADRARAAELVANLALSGAVTSLLSGGGPRLVALLRLMQQALGPVSGPLEALPPRERLARTVPLLLEAVLQAMQGGLAGAAAPLEQADALLDTAALLALRDRWRDDEAADGLVLWGPAMQVLIKAAQAAVVGLTTGDRGAAAGHARAAVLVIGAFARHELTHAKLGARFEPHVAGLERLLSLTVDLVAADEAARPAVARALAEVAATLPVDVAAGEGAEAARWLALIGALSRDAVWLLGELKVGQPVDRAVLDQATQTLDALGEAWAPESRFLSATLMILRAAQQSLPGLPALLAQDQFDASKLLAMPRIADAASSLRAALARRGTPEARLTAVASGDLDLLLVDLLATVLDIKLSTLSADPDALIAVIEGRARQLLAAAAAQAPNETAPLLALLDAWMLAGADRTAEAVAVAERGRALTAGTAFADYGWLFDLHAARWAYASGLPTQAVAALDRADAECPGLGWLTAQARAMRAEPTAAHALFAQARAGAARWRTGGPKAALVIQLIDGNSIVNVNVELMLHALLLGGSSGTFQIGAGHATNPSGPVGVQVKVNGDGSPAEFVADTLVQEAWQALVVGDDAAADRAFAQLTDLMGAGSDPGWFGAPAGPSATGPVAQTPLLARHAVIWTAVLAELRGHAFAAQGLYQRLKMLGAFERSPYGTLSVCDDEEVEGDGPLAGSVRCVAPRVLTEGLSTRDRAAFAALVLAKAQALDGATGAPKAWAKALTGARRWKALPRWIGGKKVPEAVARSRALAAGDGAVRAAVYAGPFGCTAMANTISDADLPPATLAPALARCGAITAQFALAGQAAKTGDADALETLLRQIAGKFHLRARLLPVGFMQAVLLLDALPAPARPAAAQRFAALADELGQPDFAVDLRALHLRMAGGGAPSEALLKAAVQGQGRAESRAYIKAQAWPAKE